MIKCLLKVELAKNDLTQKELAEITEIRLPTINDMITGKSKAIGIDNLNKICKVLRCNVSDLFTYIEDWGQKQNIILLTYYVRYFYYNLRKMQVHRTRNRSELQQMQNYNRYKKLVKLFNLYLLQKCKLIPAMFTL